MVSLPLATWLSSYFLTKRLDGAEELLCLQGWCYAVMLVFLVLYYASVSKSKWGSSIKIIDGKEYVVVRGPNT